MFFLFPYWEQRLRVCVWVRERVFTWNAFPGVLLVLGIINIPSLQSKFVFREFVVPVNEWWLLSLQKSQAIQKNKTNFHTLLCYPTILNVSQICLVYLPLEQCTFVDWVPWGSASFNAAGIEGLDSKQSCSCVATSRTNAFLHSIFWHTCCEGRQQAKLGHETTWNNQVIAQAWDNFAAIHSFVNWLLHVVVLWWVLRDKQVRRSWGMQLIFYPCGYHGATDDFVRSMPRAVVLEGAVQGLGLSDSPSSVATAWTIPANRLFVSKIESPATGFVLKLFWPRLYLYAPAGATLRCNLFVLGSACAFSFEKTVEGWLGVNLNGN